ncbi:MAG: hypothetical protein ABI310_02360 [Microbacteriaceae bacterium]
MEYILFACGFVIFIPFSIWAVAAGLQNTRQEKREQKLALAHPELEH